MLSCISSDILINRLVEATLPYGLVPPVVMEFPGITGMRNGNDLVEE